MNKLDALRAWLGAQLIILGLKLVKVPDIDVSEEAENYDDEEDDLVDRVAQGQLVALSDRAKAMRLEHSEFDTKPEPAKPKHPEGSIAARVAAARGDL